jgi:hypothetical protein
MLFFLLFFLNTSLFQVFCDTIIYNWQYTDDTICLELFFFYLILIFECLIFKFTTETAAKNHVFEKEGILVEVGEIHKYRQKCENWSGK